MQVQQSIEWSVKFSGLVSAWWMLPLMALLAGAAVWLYRRQGKGLAVWQTAGLIALRVAIVLAIAFLAFRPRLIFRRILTYPGRILMVLDDSTSMLTRDTAMPDSEALRIARRLGRLPAGSESSLDGLSRTLEAAATTLRAFENFSRAADRKQDAFWDRAGVARGDIVSVLDKAAAEAPAAPGLTAEDRASLRSWIRSIQDLKGGLDAFFTGGRDPGGRAYDEFVEHLAALSRELLALQAALDDRAIASGDAGLRAAAEAVRSASRLEGVRAKLADLHPGLSKLAPGQGILVVSLMAKTQTPWNSFRVSEWQGKEGPTDITGALKDALTEPSEFPLAAVVLVSDGRNLGAVPLREVVQEAASRQAPVMAAGVGSEREPGDLALVSVQAPSFAVKGTPMRVRAGIRNSMASAFDGRLQVFLGKTAVASDTIPLVPGRQMAVLESTPDETGFFKYTAQLDSVAGEVFPRENNSLDFITHVRDDKIRVLFLDWKPRWETRFALNILQRLPYVDLNSIIALVQEGSRLPRGLQKGTWPESAEALRMYDLVVIGDLPPGLLLPAELTALRDWVNLRGGTLCVIGARRASGAWRGTPLDDVLPAVSFPSDAEAPRGTTEGLCATPAGRVHVLTRALARGGGTNATDIAAAQGLVLTGEGRPPRPLLAVRYAGAGKTLSLLDDDLWRRLHPAALEAHTELYAALVNWAVEGGFRPTPGGKPDPELAVDARRFPPGADVQVWLRNGGGSNAVIEAVRGADVLASAAVKPGARSVPAGVVFTGLTPGSVVFRLKGLSVPGTDPIEIGADNRELIDLSRDVAFLRELAASTGGRYLGFEDLESCFRDIPPKQRVEMHERIWPLWGWGPLLSVLALAMAGQWIWRKWVGLV